MAYRPPKKPPQFADLISVLAQSKNTDNALYQTVQEIINRLEQFVGGAGAAISATQAAQGPLGGGGGGSTPGPPLGAHAPTHYNGASDPVTITALAGFTGNVANFLRADGTFQPPPTGGVPANHAPTHQPGGADPMQVDAAINVGSLRTLGNGPNQAAPGNRGPLAHAPTHSEGAADPVDIKNLAGYAGGTTQFLRADKTFAVPPGGAGGGMNLDYLGDYAPSTYNDGDIVIGPDGIAYMCVVDGTTTPPEPWPGVGIAINPAVDATYWTVSNHPQLTNERVMSSLANGYVKSTAGEPSTVPSIPPGDLPPFIAYTNIDNFFVPQTFATLSSVTGTYSALVFNATTGPVNGKVWRLINYADGLFRIENLNDASSAVLAGFYFYPDGVLSAANFSGGGVGLTNLNASNLASGLAAPLRLGNGTPDATTFLRGDSTWQPISSIGFPSGLIVISVTPCPVGWTRIASWDGLFLRSGPTIGVTGGAWDHAHGPGSYAAANHGHGSVLSLSGGTDLQGTHAHGHTLSGSGTTGPSQGGSSGADAGGSFTAPVSTHFHDVGITISGGINNDGAHSHNLSGSVTLVAEAPGVTGASALASSLPPFIDIYYCQKN